MEKKKPRSQSRFGVRPGQGLNFVSEAKSFLKRLKTGIRDQELDPSKHSLFYSFIVHFDRKVRNYRECFLYIVFLGLFLAIVFMQRDVLDSFVMEQGLDNYFTRDEISADVQPFAKTFQDLGTLNDINSYLVGLLGPALDQATSYNGQELSPNERMFMQGSNRLIGGVRLRQLRVRGDSCHVNPIVASIITNCYPEFYEEKFSEMRPFGPPDNPTKYQWMSSSQTGALERFSVLSSWTAYDGAGYVVDLPLGSNYTDTLAELVNDGFLGPSTRFLAITLNFLNVDLDYRLAIFQLIVEITSGGLFVPYSSFNSFRLFLYHNPIDYLRLVFEISFCLLLIFFIWREVVQLYMEGLRKYFAFPSWNTVEMLNLVLFVLTVVFYGMYLYNRPWKVIDFASSEYQNLETIGQYPVRMYQVCAFNIFISFVKIFKFLTLNKATNILWEILLESSPDLTRFGIIFLILFCAFLIMGVQGFGTELINFKTVGSAFGSCVAFFIGAPPDFEELQAINRILGPFFFVSFIFIIVVVMANMFIAIVSGKYRTTIEKAADPDDFFQLADLKLELLFVKEAFRLRRLHMSRHVSHATCKPLDEAWNDEDGALGDRLLTNRERNRLSIEEKILTKTQRVTELRRMHDFYLKMAPPKTVEQGRKSRSGTTSSNPGSRKGTKQGRRGSRLGSIFGGAKGTYRPPSIASSVPLVVGTPLGRPTISLTEPKRSVLFSHDSGAVQVSMPLAPPTPSQPSLTPPPPSDPLTLLVEQRREAMLTHSPVESLATSPIGHHRLAQLLGIAPTSSDETQNSSTLGDGSDRPRANLRNALTLQPAGDPAMMAQRHYSLSVRKTLDEEGTNRRPGELDE